MSVNTSAVRDPARDTPTTEFRGKYRAVPLADGLVSFDNDRLLVLNRSARLIWEARAAGLDTEQIADRLCVEYGIDRRRAIADVAATERSWRRPSRSSTAQSEAVPPRGAPVASQPQIEDGPTTSRTYQVSDLTVRLRYRGETLGTLLFQPLEHLQRPGLGRCHVDVVVIETTVETTAWVNGEVLVAFDSPQLVAMHVLYELARLAACSRDWLVIMHAAAVARGGRCAVLPGAGGSGKSTLAAALLRSGFTYLGDDLVPLERHSRVAVPVPMSLRIKSGSMAVLREWGLGLDELPVFAVPGAPETRYLPPPGFAAANSTLGLPVGCIVFPCYRPGAGTQVEPTSKAAALEGILGAGSVVGPPVERARVEELVAWIEEVPAFNLTYGDLGEAALAVRDIMVRSTPGRAQREVQNIYGRVG